MINFDKEKHEYTLNGKVLISVTQLLGKHGLATNYGNIPEVVLERAADFGNEQHEELEKYVKGELTYEEVNVITKMGIDLLKSKKIETFLSEQILYNNWLAGTCDMVGLQDEEFIMVDFKFTSSLNKNAVMWQTNIYKRLLWEQHQIKLSRLYVLWYDKANSEFKLIELPMLEDSLVDKLFQAEIEGKIFTEEQSFILSVEANQLKVVKMLDQINETKEFLDKLNLEFEIVKEELYQEMEKVGISSFDFDEYKITRVAPSKQNKIDTKKIILDYGVDESKYITEIYRKGYLKITKKGRISQEEVIKQIKEKNRRAIK